MSSEIILHYATNWLTQSQMADLFQADRSVISKHIRNILECGELDRDSTCAKIAQVQNEGNRIVKREIEYYNLDMSLALSTDDC